MPAILNAIATGVPPHRVSQQQVREQVSAAIPGGLPERIARVYDSTGIDTRHIVREPGFYFGDAGLKARNDVYLTEGQKLLEAVAADALGKAGLEPAQIDAIVCVSTTGIATPSIASQMLAPLGFRRDALTVPLFGHGCAGGVMGLQMARDLVLADPARRVLLLTLELCSLTFRPGDASKKAIIATSLFADGASACVVSGGGEGPGLGGFAQVTWPDTRAMMGWDVDDMGLGLVLSRDIPSFVRREFAPVVEAFLTREGVELTSLGEPACHPGGRKVIEALEEQFDHLPNGLAHTREVLRGHGNMSAPTVHFVLEQLLGEPGRGPVLLTALGPGFTGALGLVHR